jgi:hypothetical protein
MIGKITTAVALALLLGSAGAASARTGKHAQVKSAWQAPFANSYYNEDYWRGIEGVAPHGVEQRDPYAGTIWEDVAPY